MTPEELEAIREQDKLRFIVGSLHYRGKEERAIHALLAHIAELEAQAESLLSQARETIAVQRTRIAELASDASGTSCPCNWTTPCSEMCSCVRPDSSSGCSRCCRFGSVEQRRAKAEQLAILLRSGA